MKLRLLFLPLILLSGCSTKLFKMKVVKKEAIQETFYYKKTSLKENTFTDKRWAALLIISNNYFPDSYLNLMDKLCPKSDVMGDVSIDNEFIALPPVYISTDLVYRGTCHE